MESPVWRPWLRELSRRHTYIRYDQRGCGLARLTATPEGAARILETFHSVDVTHLASELRVPALVLHARRDECAPFDEGRRIAALIPGARFIALDSANHVLLEGEPAWAVFLEAVDDFLAEAPAGAGADATQAAAGAGALTAAEAAVLELLARGLDNRAIAGRLGKSEKTVRNQVSMIFDKLGVRTRAEAIVHALGRRGAS